MDITLYSRGGGGPGGGAPDMVGGGPGGLGADGGADRGLSLILAGGGGGAGLCGGGGIKPISSSSSESESTGKYFLGRCLVGFSTLAADDDGLAGGRGGGTSTAEIHVIML